MESIWSKSAKLPDFPVLNEHLHTQVAIVGGGLAGILTADALRQAGAEVVVVEANRIGSGQTTGTTAKLTAQHGLKYQKLIHHFGADTARHYALANLTAVTQLRQLVETRSLACDFTTCTSFLYASGAAATLEQEYNACRRLGMDVFLTTDTELPFPAQALGLKHQALFHPLKLLAALAKELTIFQYSRILKIDGRTLYTAQGSITAQKIIFACHYPFINIPGLFFVRQHQERSYVLTLEGAANFQNCYLGIDGEQLSFRPHQNYLLLGGGGHRTGENREGGKYDQLEKAAKQYWPRCRVTAAWSAQDCIPMDGIPYIGRFSESHPDWLVATGFQKWGMSTSVLAAEILSLLASEKQPPKYSAIFSPQRFHLRASAKQLVEDTLCSAKGLTRRIFEPGRIPVEQLPVGHGGIVTINGKKMGAYRAENGDIYAVSPKCPHLGCQLEWNPDEKSWDCPCHGSRFDIYGQLLTGPAQTDLS